MARDRSDTSEVAVSSSSFFFSFLLGWPALVFSALSGRIAMVGSGLSVSRIRHLVLSRVRARGGLPGPPARPSDRIDLASVV
jgi:hypothetical protein